MEAQTLPFMESPSDSMQSDPALGRLLHRTQRDHKNGRANGLGFERRFFEFTRPQLQLCAHLGAFATAINSRHCRAFSRRNSIVGMGEAPRATPSRERGGAKNIACPAAQAPYSSGAGTAGANTLLSMRLLLYRSVNLPTPRSGHSTPSGASIFGAA
jgi:hypothetical protein